jgi:antibiotic biosynthesis monooxygenase (ABM) superfamily enzyme
MLQLINMTFLQTLKKHLPFDTNSFEMIVSMVCMIVAGVFAFFNRPTSIPLSPFNVVMVGTMMGFVFGYFVSIMIVSVYKGFLKRRVNRKAV